jgi:hypothetical protein
MYNITIQSNDIQLGNLNNSEKIQITIDNTASTGTVSCTPSPVISGNVVTCTCFPLDSLPGENTSATNITVSPSTVNTGTQTSICSFADLAGNIGSASGIYIVELGGSGSSGGSGGGSPSFSYTKTIPKYGEEFSVFGSVQFEFKAKERVKLKINNEYHHVGVKQLINGKAIVEIASNHIEVELGVGEDIKVDVNSDGVYDIYVILNSILSNKADLTIKYLNEVISEEKNSKVETSGEIIKGEEIIEEIQSEETEKNLTWLWIILGIALIGIIAWFFIRNKEE